MSELSLLAKATIILAGGLIGARLFRRASAAVRAAVLASTFAALVLFPFAGALLVAQPIAIPVDYATAPDLFLALQTESAPPGVSTTTDFRQPSRLPLPSIETILRATWIGGFMLVVIPLLVSIFRLRRLRRLALPWTGGQALVAELAVAGGLRRPLDVFLSEELSAPMTCGAWRPAIGLPLDAPSWKSMDLRCALVHEIEHVRRRDWPVHLVARAVCAFYWFHPLVWIAWQQLSLESERACDDAVLLREREQTEYANQLLMLARRLSAKGPTPLLSMANRSHLARRVGAVLANDLARGRVGVVAVAAIAIISVTVMLVVSPLQATPAAQDKPPAAGADAAGTFEVASIRRNTTSTIMRGPLVQPGGRVVGESLLVRLMVSTAFGIDFNRVTGGPDWVNTDGYDIEARAGDGATHDEIRGMLRTLLAERFRLVARRETREVDTFALVRVRNDRIGPRLRVAGPDCAPITPPSGLPAPPPLPPAAPPANAGVPLFATAMSIGCPRMFFGGFMAARRISMRDFVASLAGFARRPVVDRTGLSDAYDLDLTFTPDFGPRMSTPPPGAAGIVGGRDGAPGPDPAPSPNTPPNLFTALEEQLGLRLEPGRAAVEYVVIDRVERPTEN